MVAVTDSPIREGSSGSRDPSTGNHIHLRRLVLPIPPGSSRRHFPADPKGGIAPPELLAKISPMPVDIKGSGHMHFGAYEEGRRRQSSDQSISSNLKDP